MNVSDLSFSRAGIVLLLLTAAYTVTACEPGTCRRKTTTLSLCEEYSGPAYDNTSARYECEELGGRFSDSHGCGDKDYDDVIGRCNTNGSRAKTQYILDTHENYAGLEGDYMDVETRAERACLAGGGTFKVISGGG